MRDVKGLRKGEGVKGLRKGEGVKGSVCERIKEG